MRHGRAKAARRTLQFLARTQGFRIPYHVLLDGTFCVAAARMKVPIADRLVRVLQQTDPARVRFWVTRRTLEELAALAEQPTKHQESFRQALAWARDHAQVVTGPASAAAPTTSPSGPTDAAAAAALSPTAQDLIQLLRGTAEPGATKYFLASQDEQLLHTARNLAVPCLRLLRTVLLLEQPSRVADLQDQALERHKWRGSVLEEERELVSLVRSETASAAPSAAAPIIRKERRKKKAKGPNPLSCKRKATSNEKGNKKRKLDKPMK